MKNSKYVLNLLLEAYKGENVSREDSHIHVSDLLDFCPRKIALCLKFKKHVHTRKYIPPATAFTFDIGNAIQSVLVKRYRKTGKLIGTWLCASCGISFFGLDTGCPECKNNLLIYKDTTIKLNKYGVPVIGNIDILLLSEDNYHIIITEIKSIKPEGFDELKDKAELPHRKQLALYLWLLEQGASIVCDTYNINLADYVVDTKYGVVEYCCKTQKPMPFNTFDVDIDQKIIKRVEDKLKIVKNFTKDKKIPKPLCSLKDDTMAKHCSVREECFKNRRS